MWPAGAPICVWWGFSRTSRPRGAIMAISACVSIGSLTAFDVLFAKTNGAKLSLSQLRPL